MGVIAGFGLNLIIASVVGAGVGYWHSGGDGTIVHENTARNAGIAAGIIQVLSGLIFLWPSVPQLFVSILLAVVVGSLVGMGIDRYSLANGKAHWIFRRALASSGATSLLLTGIGVAIVAIMFAA